MRLTGRIQNDGLLSRNQGGGEHDIDCRTNGSRVQHDLRGVQTVLRHAGDMAADIYLGAHQLKSTGVVIQRAGTQPAPAGVTDARSAAQSQLHAHQVRGRADRLDQPVRGSAGAEASAVDFQRRRSKVTNLHAHLREDADGCFHVPDRGDIVQHAGLAVERAGKKNGKRRVFHAADVDGAVQAAPADDMQAFHIYDQVFRGAKASFLAKCSRYRPGMRFRRKPPTRRGTGIGISGCLDLSFSPNSGRIAGLPEARTIRDSPVPCRRRASEHKRKPPASTAYADGAWMSDEPRTQTDERQRNRHPVFGHAVYP